MRKREPDELPLIVVDVFDVCERHSVVIAREPDAYSWYFFGVGHFMVVEFGDRLAYNKKINKLFLDRGPILRYMLPLIPLTEVAIDQLTKECPPCVGPGDFPEMSYFPY